MVFCMAFGCSNASNRKGRKSKLQSNVSFHRLPLNDKERLRKWVVSMKLKSPHVNAYSRVCSEHFTEEMFEENTMQSQMGFSKTSRRLKKDAIPTKFVFTKHMSMSAKSREDRHRRLSERRRSFTRPKKQVETFSDTDSESDDADTSPLMNTLIEPSVEMTCSCKSVVKVDKASQTEALADPEKVEHDHGYTKPIPKKSSRKPKNNDNMPICSTPIKQVPILQHPELVESDGSGEDTGSEDVADNSKDLSYLPSSSSESDEACDLNDSTYTDDERETVFLVYESALDELIKSCKKCGSLVECTKLFRGTMVIYEWTCLNNHHGRWQSQPMVRNLPKGNLELSGSILFSGGTYGKVCDIAKTMNLKFLSERYYSKIQRSYLFPVVDALHEEKHRALIDSYKFEHVFLDGDGRSDSPGHNAKYLSYTFMDEVSDQILHFELVQVTEAPGQASTNMERLAFNRGMEYLTQKDIVVDGVATDRHPQISCDMNNKYQEVAHEYDIFHVAKNIDKKIRQKAKGKSCEDLGLWRSSIINHFWWCCSSCDGDYTVLKDKWLSVLQHVCNVHEWASADKFHKCCHDPLSVEDVNGIKWLKPDTPPHKALQDVVLNKKLLKDMKKMVLFKHTGALEVFHGMLLKYCPKRQHFSFQGMRARLQLAVMDHNENVGREQATTLDGSQRFGLAFPKRKGQWVAKKVYASKTYSFRETLMEMVIARRENPDIVLGQQYVDVPDLPSNIARTERPNKQDAIDSFRTRFKLQTPIDDTV